LSYNDAAHSILYPGSSAFVTVCDIGNGYAYASIFPGDMNGEVTVKASIYQSHLDWNYNRKLDHTLEKGIVYIFWTQASSTFDSPKRVVIQGTGGISYVSGPYRTCDYQNLVNDYIKPDEPNSCIKVDQVTGIKTQYFYVEVDDTFNGNVRIEQGTCDEYNGVSQVLISFVLLLVAIFY